MTHLQCPSICCIDSVYLVFRFHLSLIYSVAIVVPSHHSPHWPVMITILFIILTVPHTVAGPITYWFSTTAFHFLVLHCYKFSPVPQFFTVTFYSLSRTSLFLGLLSFGLRALSFLDTIPHVCYVCTRFTDVHRIFTHCTHSHVCSFHFGRLHSFVLHTGLQTPPTPQLLQFTHLWIGHDPSFYDLDPTDPVTPVPWLCSAGFLMITL